MSGPQVTPVPADRDGRPYHVLIHDVVHRLNPIEMRALMVRGERAQAHMARLTTPVGPGMTASQSRHLHVLLRERRGVTGDDRHPVLSALVGREITSASELTKAEASSAIDQLLAIAPLRPAQEGAF